MLPPPSAPARELAQKSFSPLVSNPSFKSGKFRCSLTFIKMYSEQMLGESSFQHQKVGTTPRHPHVKWEDFLPSSTTTEKPNKSKSRCCPKAGFIEISPLDNVISLPPLLPVRVCVSYRRVLDNAAGFSPRL